MKYAILIALFIITGYNPESNHQKTSENIEPDETDFVTLEMDIRALSADVWDIITNPEYAKELGSVFDENAFIDSDWELGSEVHFKYEPDNIVTTGTISKLVEEQIIHVDYDFDGFEYTEQFTLTEQDNGILLQVYAGPYVENYDEHETVWKNWLQKVKELSETE